MCCIAYELHSKQNLGRTWSNNWSVYLICNRAHEAVSMFKEAGLKLDVTSGPELGAIIHCTAT